jgi:AbiJ N-terminal domain 4
MAVFDLFSKRQRAMKGNLPDIYVYDEIPESLRVQVVHIVNDALSLQTGMRDRGIEFLRFIHDILCREYGKFSLVKEAEYRGTQPGDVLIFLLRTESVDEAIDAIESMFRVIDRLCRDQGFQFQAKPKISPDEAIAELNHRFREHAVGFQFESGEIIRVDSQFIHQEAVKPALALLSAKEFQGVNEEFLRAHEHYRHSRHEECLNDCLKAFESTLKTICVLREWQHDPNATAKALLSIVYENALVPTYLQTQFTSLRSTLESGVPTIRNKLGGHGQGAQTRSVPSHFVSYQLHLTASCIVFLIECHHQFS